MVQTGSRIIERAAEAPARIVVDQTHRNLRDAESGGLLTGLLVDSAPRVRTFAAIAVGRIGFAPATRTGLKGGRSGKRILASRQPDFGDLLPQLRSKRQRRASVEVCECTTLTGRTVIPK